MAGERFPNHNSREFPIDLNIRAFPSQGGGVPRDPQDQYFSNVSLLLHMDGANGSSTFTDASTYNRTLTAVGSARVNTGDAQFGGASMLCDGTGDYLTTPDDNLFSVDASDFTMEGWVNLTAHKTNICIDKRDGSGAEEFSFLVNANGALTLQLFRSGSSVLNILGPTSLSLGAWYFIAAARSGVVSKIFLDGNEEASATQSNTPTANTQVLQIGRSGFNSTRDLNGRLDEVRFTSGVARYTGNFTPPTAPFLNE